MLYTLMHSRRSPSSKVLCLAEIIENILFHLILFIYLFIFFWPCHMACRVLAHRPGIEPAPPAVGVRRLNHWTAGEGPNFV